MDLARELLGEKSFQAQGYPLSMLASVDTSSTPYIGIFDIMSKLLFRHLLLKNVVNFSVFSTKSIFKFCHKFKNKTSLFVLSALHWNKSETCL